MTRPERGPRPRGRGGFTIVELAVVITLMSILVALSVPSFQRAVEQGKADLAVANLRAVWSAERFYWLDNRAYTPDLNVLRTLDLIAPEVVAPGGPFSYAVTLSADGGFSVTATRQGTTRWRGSVAIDQSGQLTGSLQTDGMADITPGLQ